MTYSYKRRRLVIVVTTLFLIFVALIAYASTKVHNSNNSNTVNSDGSLAVNALKILEVKPDDVSRDYDRSEFMDGWGEVSGCDMRNIILFRDLVDTVVTNGCEVSNGTLNDPYTSKTVIFVRGKNTSSDVQIDHVVALSDAWRKGAQNLTYNERNRLANDPLGLLAVDGGANQEKSGSDASQWLPPNKLFRCEYVTRQIAVKIKYSLWVSLQEKNAIAGILSGCPDQKLPINI